MSKSQVLPSVTALALRTERLGPLPLINHFLERLGLEAVLKRFVPTADRRIRLPYAKGLGVMLRSVLVEREPMYRQQETVNTYAAEAFGLDESLLAHIGDDAIGRALDRLFDAERAALLTEVVVAAVERFEVAFEELHNDSTTVRLCGQYRQACGRKLRGQRAPAITYGHSKDHRPDLKQLLFILTTTHDGGVPVQFRCEHGNASDSRSHQQTWEALRQVAGGVDFLYVADSKLCSREPMDYIERRGGRFVCVLPRARQEDAEFREWIQTHEPEWERVRDEANPRRIGGPRDRWWAYRVALPSQEGWPVVWVYSALLALRQEKSRRERITQAGQALDDLATRLAGPRARRRTRAQLQAEVKQIIGVNKVSRYVVVELIHDEQHSFRQATRGRPGPNTRYVRKTRKFWRLAWQVDEDNIAYDRKSDGMYPLLTNDRTLSDTQVFEAHKRQPTIEKRFEQTKTVFEIAPVLLKNEGRIEALFLVYFLALLVQSLIERELRRAMVREKISELPLYPEERQTRRPTGEQIFRLFSLAERHTLQHKGNNIRTFKPQLTELQRQVLRLLGVPTKAYSCC
ncbi:MAG: IS1634 family transposase [Gammaproteobacteria bacterium]